MRGLARHPHEVRAVLRLLAEGSLSDYEIARRTGVPRSTVLNWRRGKIPDTLSLGPFCEQCRLCHPVVADLPAAEYGYLLGQYLGDGTVAPTGSGLALRIATDSRYPGIIAECRAAIVAVRKREPYIHRHKDVNLVTIVSYWNAWPCLIPQHGPGRKHARRIELEWWQQAIVAAYPGPFLRGLIHSDGWRGLNRVRVKGKDYAYPRYQFSNRSADIRRIFTDACDLVGVEWRRWGRYHVSVARREAVALLDEFVGPKR
jgi:hypothetical protein